MQLPKQLDINALKSNQFLRHNIVFFIGSMLVALVNYLYYPVLGRSLKTTQFGEVQALISIFLQVALFLNVLADVSVNIVANEKDESKRNTLVFELERFSTLIMLAVVVIGLLFVQKIKLFLHFSEVTSFMVLGASLVVGASLSLRSAFLRGKSAYSRLVIASLTTASSKLILAAILVAAGFGTVGALGGLLLAQVITYGYVRYSASKLGLRGGGGDKFLRLPDFSVIKPQLPFAGLVLIVSVATTLLFSVDTVLVKHYFSAHTAGLYAGIATTGRIIYFVTGSVATVLLSSVHLSASRRHNRKLLLQSIGLHSLIGGAVLLVFAAAPQFVVKLLLGSRYLPYAWLLPRLSVVLFLMALVNLIFSYDVALRRPSIGVISVLGIITTALAIGVHHATPQAVVSSLLVGSLAMLALRGVDSLRRNVWLKHKQLPEK